LIENLTMENAGAFIKNSEICNTSSQLIVSCKSDSVKTISHVFILSNSSLPDILYKTISRFPITEEQAGICSARSFSVRETLIKALP